MKISFEMYLTEMSDLLYLLIVWKNFNEASKHKSMLSDCVERREKKKK